jgi:predicted dehydrogenase
MSEGSPPAGPASAERKPRVVALSATVSTGAPAPIALIGAGFIGRMHAQRIAQRTDLKLVAVVDWSDSARQWAAQQHLASYADTASMLAKAKPAAVIVATPNATHLGVGEMCLRAGVPVLMEKPIASSVLEAERLCAVARECGVPLLVGHQRRHSPYLQAAKRVVSQGQLGRIVTVSMMANWFKPEGYHTAPGNEWRGQLGGGPVLINMIHDIDMLLHLLGPVLSVQALTSHAVRGLEVEDTAAALMRFASGALATLTTTDCAATPWNYDLGAGENENFPQVDADALFISGTHGSLSLPGMKLWRYDAERGWSKALRQEALTLQRHDPYDEQLRHLRAVIDGREAPVCSGEDGLATLRAAMAVHESVRTGLPVHLPVGRAGEPLGDPSAVGLD